MSDQMQADNHIVEYKFYIFTKKRKYQKPKLEREQKNTEIIRIPANSGNDKQVIVHWFKNQNFDLFIYEHTIDLYISSLTTLHYKQPQPVPT